SPFAFLLVPTQPWVATRMDEKYNNQNDHRTPILPPVRDGFPPPLCEDPPSDREVLRTMPRVVRGVPYVVEEFRDDVQIIKNRMVDKIDPPRFFPLIGMAQLHHCHWECVIYYTETVQSSYPFPTYVRKRRGEGFRLHHDLVPRPRRVGVAEGGGPGEPRRRLQVVRGRGVAEHHPQPVRRLRVAVVGRHREPLRRPHQVDRPGRPVEAE